MVPEKKPIDEALEENNALEQSEALEKEDVSEQLLEFDKNSTILTTENGMYSKKDLAVKPLSVRRFHTVITLFVIVIVLILGSVVVGLLPEQDSASEFENNTIYVKKISSENIKKIVINNPKGRLVLLSEKRETSSSQGGDAEDLYASSTIWSLEGYDPTLIASSSVNAAADNIATIYASRIMEEDLSKKGLYGFNNPLITAEVFVQSGMGENYTLTIGASSPDGSGYYATVTGDNKIYLLSTTTVESFNKTPEELANAVIVETPTIENVPKKTDRKYFDEETGTIATYESIEISGTKYGKKVVITPIEDNQLVQCSINLGNYSRYADPTTVSEVFGIMTNSLVAMDTYVLNPSAADIKKYGLSSPEAIITIKCGSIVTTVRATMYDKKNQYYAVMVDGRNAIYAVTADALSMLNHNIEDFYYRYVFQDFIYTYKNIVIETPEKSYSFDIKHNTSNDTFTATSNGKQIDDALLSTYYQYFLVLSPEVSDSYPSGKTALKATLTYKNSSKAPRVIELVKISARRYLLKIDGFDMGTVTSVAFDPLVIYAENVMNNQGIPEP